MNKRISLNQEEYVVYIYISQLLPPPPLLLIPTNTISAYSIRGPPSPQIYAIFVTDLFLSLSLFPTFTLTPWSFALQSFLLCSPLPPICNNHFCLRSVQRYSTRTEHNLIAIFFAYHLQTVFMFIFKSNFIALCVCLLNNVDCFCSMYCVRSRVSFRTRSLIYICVCESINTKTCYR